MIRALDDVTLEVREGEIFGFLGPNGAGKSTLIRLLLGYLHATAGRATVLGLDAARDSVAIRGRIGYLPGGIALYDGLTGERHLDYLAELAGRPSVRRAELCDRLELDARTLRRPIRDYSRGMRQKIGIVQALQHDPELAILDEPSEGLDPLMQRAFYDDARRAAGGRADGVLQLPRPVRGRARVRPGRRRPGRPARRRRGRRHAPRAATAAGGDAARPGPRRTSRPSPASASSSSMGDTLTCALEGDPRPFLAAIAGAPVADVVIEAARLEDAFLELYEGPEAARPTEPASGR